MSAVWPLAVGRSSPATRYPLPATRYPLPATRYPRPDSCPNHRLDPTTDVEVADDLHPPWLRASTQVIQNAVHRTFVEDSVVPKAPQIELETLELDANVARHIRDDDRPEIRSPTLEQRQLTRIGLHTA